MGSNHDLRDCQLQRFEKAVRELIEEGSSFVDQLAWLEAAAARVDVDLQEFLPTHH
jgi:hypothetical protein